MDRRRLKHGRRPPARPTFDFDDVVYGIHAIDEALAAEVYDVRDDVHRFATDSLEHGHGSRSDEADCRPNGVRNLHIIPARVAGLSSDLRRLAATLAGKTDRAGIGGGAR